MNEENNPKDNARNGFVIIGFHQRGGTCHHSFFGRTSNYKKNIESEDVRKWEIAMQE
jgi:hypothetical protein